MAQQFVLEIERLKISKEVWKTSKSRRIVAFMEALYNNQIVKSTDSKVYSGSTYALPWDDKLKRVQINFFFIDDLITMDIGSAIYKVSEDGNFRANGDSINVTLHIYPNGGTVSIGKAYAKVSVQELFDDENKREKKTSIVPQNRQDHNFAVPDFRFKRLSRVLHWERIRSFNISQTVQNSDVRSLLTCIDDITTGDISQEDVDPTLYKTIQLAQYSSQYLLSCRKLMKERETVLKTALKTFQEEEELLDLKLAKMRARDKALKRESRDLDDLTVEYTSALRELNPTLLNQLYKTYQNKLRPVQDKSYNTRQYKEQEEYEDDDSREYIDHQYESLGRRGNRKYLQEGKAYRSTNLWQEETTDGYKQVEFRHAKPHHHSGNNDDNKMKYPEKDWERERGSSNRGDYGSDHRDNDRQDTWARPSSRYIPPNSTDSRDTPDTGDNWAHPRSNTTKDLRNDWEHAAGRLHHAPQSPQMMPVDHQETVQDNNTEEVSRRNHMTSVAPSAGAVHRTAGPKAITSVRQVGVGRATNSDKGSDSDTRSEESPVRGAAPSRTHFVDTVSPVPAVVPKVSSHAVNVGAEGEGEVKREDRPAASIDLRSIPVEVVEPPQNEIEAQVIPKPSSSIDVTTSSLAWTGTGAKKPPSGSVVQFSLDTTPMRVDTPLLPGQQSVSEMSTVMSVDSLAPLATHTPSIPSISPITPASVPSAFASNTQSYEGVDLSEFIQQADQTPQPGALGDTGVLSRRSDGISARSSLDLYEEDFEPDSVESPVRRIGSSTVGGVPSDGAEAADESMLVEEFDDSVHMDHHPVKAKVADKKAVIEIAHQLPNPNWPGQSNDRPPSSATKKQQHETPQRSERPFTDPEYSMEGDSPFQNLSASKDYNRLLSNNRRNTSHISSNDSRVNQSGVSLTEDSSYDMSAFEDEDDPFGKSGSSQKNLNLTQRSGASDIDQSKSIMIDFVLPSESKDLQRQGGNQVIGGSVTASSTGGGRKYVEEDISGDVDLFSPLAGPRHSQGRAGGLSGRDDDQDDDVLMGTAKITFGNTQEYGTGSFTPGQRFGQSDTFSRDSLGSGSLRPNGGSGEHTPIPVPNASQTPSALRGNRTKSTRLAPFSPVEEHGRAQDASYEESDTGGGEDEDESIPPPTYDALTRSAGGADDSVRASSISYSQAQSSVDVSSYYESTDAGQSTEDASMHIHNIEPEISVEDRPDWSLGRASMDLLEMASALDVYITAVRLDSQHTRIYTQIQVKLEFLGVQSSLSEVVPLSHAEGVQPVNFSAHMQFTAEQEELLIEEIAELDDAIALQVLIIDADTNETIGSANVELWAMIEDSVHLLRKEVEILNLDMSSEMGIVLLDAKGFRLLKKCANAVRNRRTHR